jgi:hypothetical protein
LNEGDKISDNYRKEIDKLLVNQSDEDLYNPLNQAELDEIWEEISTEMDIEEVWKNILSELDIARPLDSGSDLIMRVLAAVLIILVGLIPVKKAIIDSGIGQTDISIETRHNEQSAASSIKNKGEDSSTGEQKKGDLSPALRSSLDKRGDAHKLIPAAGSRTGATQEIPMPLSYEAISGVLTVTETADSSLVVSLDKIPTRKSGISPALFPDDLKKINELSKTDFSTSGSSLPLTDNKRISLGFIISFRNTWLLNYETLNGFKSESLNTTEIVFFPEVGLSMNYSLNNSWLLQADGFFSSNTGQEYLDYIYGVYSRKKITLNYSTIAPSIKHKFMISSNYNPRSSINVFAGGYFSVLHYAYQEVNSDRKSIGSQYRKFDFGVRLGGEYELQISDQLSLVPGLFLSIGIPNIYKGNDYVPGYFRRTHNGRVGFHIAAYYHFD